ncbi:plant synaptotagmin [Striga asiatica]|uniref:Plant synaptotagmin n=1 Tax=Striga asiatica TaxID=4170 RepID=A0A5A7PCP8_STRAF|nr:plant synaptotagmin [Striga asiatica]
MGRTKKKLFDLNEALESLYKLLEQQPLLPLVIPMLVVLWVFEKWFFSLSNWVLLALAVWATFQPVTPLEHCEWLNKLLYEIWLNYINPKLSLRFASIVERRLKHRKSKLIVSQEKIELQEFSLGSRPPLFGLHGTRWSTSGDQRIMRLGFDWDTDEIYIMLFAKLAMPLMGTARIVVNSIHIKGDLLLMPILEGKAIAYSFVSTPEVRLGVAFGSGGSQSLPATELPGVSSWLVKVATDTLNKRMVEPRRQCIALPTADLQRKAVGGVLYVTIISAKNISGCTSTSYLEDYPETKELQTFVEIEAEELTRRTDVRSGTCPRWDNTFNLVLHDSVGIIKFHLYKRTPGSAKYDFLTSCEVKMRYVPNDSTIYWAIGADSTVIAKYAEVCGKEIEMTIPFEGTNLGELTVRLVLKEWQFTDGSHSLTSLGSGSRLSLNGPSNYFSKTGRKICITVVEGKDLVVKDKIGKSDPYVKLQYGKATQKTKSVPHSPNPTWNQRFEFDEIGGGEYLKIKCFTEETFGDESIGSALVNLEGLVEGLIRDVYIPLEKVNSGELRLQIEAVKLDDKENSMLVIIEARDLIAADIRGTSDPFVRVHYGNLKRSTKVMYKTLTPKWHQTFEFPDDGSQLTLHVKDHNSVLPSSSIGDCVVEYQMLPPNEMADKWIPLQGVKRGEIHIQITRKLPQPDKKPGLDSSHDRSTSSADFSRQISNQIKQMMMNLRANVDDDDLEGVSRVLSELESLQESREEYVVQLETEQMLLINKINELGQEIFNSTSPLTRTATIP